MSVTTADVFIAVTDSKALGAFGKRIDNSERVSGPPAAATEWAVQASR